MTFNLDLSVKIGNHFLAQGPGMFSSMPVIIIRSQFINTNSCGIYMYVFKCSVVYKMPGILISSACPNILS